MECCSCSVCRGCARNFRCIIRQSCRRSTHNYYAEICTISQVKNTGLCMVEDQNSLQDCPADGVAYLPSFLCVSSVQMSSKTLREARLPLAAERVTARSIFATSNDSYSGVQETVMPHPFDRHNAPLPDLLEMLSRRTALIMLFEPCNLVLDCLPLAVPLCLLFCILLLLCIRQDCCFAALWLEI